MNCPISLRCGSDTCNASHGIAAAEVESRVLDGLRDILAGNEALIKEFTATLKAGLTNLKKHQNGEQHHLARELADVERGITTRTFINYTVLRCYQLHSSRLNGDNTTKIS